MAGRGAPPVSAGARLDDLPPDVLDLISQRWLAEVCPLFDSGDVLELAASLSVAGGPACAHLARSLFAFLSPRLGMELPIGVSQASSVAQLKAACREWELPVSGNKAALLARLLDQVQDGEVDKEGNPPRHCLVSAATRRELSGRRETTVSEGTARQTFQLLKSDLEHLPTPYLLADIKRAALKRFKGWQGVLREKRRKEDFSQELADHSRDRIQAMKEGLLARGHDEELASLFARSAHAVMWIWDKKDEPASAACDNLEKFLFAAIEAQEYFVEAQDNDTWEAPRSMRSLVADWTRRERVIDAALSAWVSDQPSLQAIQEDPSVPDSLLPRLEALWEEQEQD